MEVKSLFSKTYQVDMACGKGCDGTMHFKEFTTHGDPPSCIHRCSKCNRMAYYPKVYPHNVEEVL